MLKPTQEKKLAPSLPTERELSNNPNTVKRVFYECKKLLQFSHFKYRNPELTKDQLKELWFHPCIEFYCCECYQEKRLSDKFLSDRERQIKQFLIAHLGKNSFYSNFTVSPWSANHKHYSKRINLIRFLPAIFILYLHIL